MVKSESIGPIRLVVFGAKGKEASGLRRRKHEVVRQYGIPENFVAGSLVVTYRRCGKATCRCAADQGHPMWSLTFSVDGAKTVLPVSRDWLPWLQPLAERSRRYRKAVAEVLTINAQLLSLWHQQEREKRRHRVIPEESRINSPTRSAHHFPADKK